MRSMQVPLAFIYDRCASNSYRQLGMRLAACRRYAKDAGWTLAGRWCDLGDYALSMRRPQLSALVSAMRAAADHREVLCLVHTWERLATDATHRLLLQQRVVEAGGWAITTFGECDRYRAFLLGGKSPVAPHGRSTTTPDTMEAAR
ncbi:recombinase family protein [Streptomyces sp. N2A]|uniref:recombinase family protein n=1 Tax=Streptomyces sp. N2A TaxID=3073936 RepID=UPI0028701845|nr:recombinase family protein [Streptomyces sp. N2A]